MTTRPRARPQSGERPHARRADVLRSARSSAAEQVAESVRWMIVDGLLRPGQKIAEESIALELGVSRVPVREALIQMERDGLVVSRANVGAFVAPFDESVIRDHFEVVGRVQGLAAGRTAAVKDRALLEQLAQIRDTLARERDPLAANSIAVEFQRLVNRGCGSNRLRSVLRSLSRILPMDIFVHIPGSVPAQQEAINAMYTAISTRKRIEETFVGVAHKRADLIVADLRTRAARSRNTVVRVGSSCRRTRCSRLIGEAMEMGGIQGELVESWPMDDEMALPLIRLWCEVLEDANPMYHDAAYAAHSRHGGIVAPGPMLLPLTTRPEWSPAGSVKSISEGLSQEYPDYPHAASLSTMQYYRRPMRIGERPMIHWFQAPVSDETMTERGPGLIIPRYFSFRDANDAEIAGYRIDQLRYRDLSQSAPAPPPGALDGPPATVLSPRQSRSWDSAEVGDVLAPITMPITLKRCIRWVAATRDFYEVHHDDGFARSAGEPSLFIGVHFAHGLMGRCGTDWSGPEGELRTLDFKAHGRVYLGEQFTVQGRVARVFRDSDETRVDLELTGSTERALTHRATLTMFVPAGIPSPSGSRQSGN